MGQLQEGINCRTPSPYLSLLFRQEARTEGIDLNPYLHRTQYRVVRFDQNPFKLCDFSLVTLIAVLY